MSERSLLGAHMEQELVSQPEMWRRAIAQQQPEDLLPAKGAKVAVVGFGASCFIADAYPAMGHRHDPISNAAPNRVTWILGTQPEGLDTDVTRERGPPPAGRPRIYPPGDPGPGSRVQSRSG